MWRRTAILGVAASALTACGAAGRPRADVPAVEAALHAAVRARPGYVSGRVRYQDGVGPGTRISGNITLAADDHGRAIAEFTDVLRAVHGAYRNQENTRTASVRLRAHWGGDTRNMIDPDEVVRPADGLTVDTDDLARHFGPP
ncbi:hypothetical protein [Prauserella rugosa]|uniref:Uncharacterized protein n=1 Tax=Prauserella rugosa TaxID=43354 RepID=A0A660C589_9PSEU|nr:hypothetical protein [Prauserella rugosa]KID30012.1 hypothetical protein HQ32_02891 [Prauserella sp. Am3]KMS89828.1 hypothetical protein ACZ91_18385 [Streptomyces regensis]TWH18708.1 hypothetical protein JD82_00529 [Prauserella rugosa]